MGNRNLRKLLVVGAHAVLFHRKSHTEGPVRRFVRSSMTLGMRALANLATAAGLEATGPIAAPHAWGAHFVATSGNRRSTGRSGSAADGERP
jgi:hypothetical protein